METKRNAVVLGLGVSGRAAALMLAREGSHVIAMDEADKPETRLACEPLMTQGIEVLFGAKNLPHGEFGLCVVSPGIAIEHRWLAELRHRGVEIVPEFELGWSRWKSRVIAVTGTNGKSTAVKWIAESLREAGFSAEPCGNYGRPVCDVAMQSSVPDWIVIEVSSFQLETENNFRADVGILLNLLPNHLDRHPNLHSYAAAKSRLFLHNNEKDFCIVPAEELERMKIFPHGRGSWRTFGPGGEFDFRAGIIMHRNHEIADLRGTYFDNEVLGVNAAAVIAGLDAAGVEPACAVRAAQKFSPLPHRMETVGEIGGVKFINDSKATTLSAVSAALKMCAGRVRLIAGGLLKEQPGEEVKEMLARRAAGVYLIGLASEDLFRAWADVCPCHRCGTLDRAAMAAFGEAREGDTILLSPGCASFDQFTGYQQRGEVFRSLVKNLSGS
jgi:UDP-N-acetylmuramoylalanine--D-glutamate ligase